MRDVLTLFRHPSEKLTVRQAHSWTEHIADNLHPAAKDALRLCYYMRSQGFDTYADVRDGSINLYLSKQVSLPGVYEMYRRRVLTSFAGTREGPQQGLVVLEAELLDERHRAHGI